MKQKPYVLNVSDKCPCEASNKPLMDCCLFMGKFLKKSVPSIVPPKARTGYSHPRCYLAHTQNCSEGITSEHYISATVLSEIGQKVSVQNLHWLPEGEAQILGISSLTAKILCKRHNEALSPLDTEAGLFFRAIRHGLITSAVKSLSRKRQNKLLSGEALELWFLKVACGIFYSKNASDDGAILFENRIINERYIKDIFMYNLWPSSQCGLYIRGNVDQSFTFSDSIKVTPISSRDKTVYVGIQICLSGLDFMLFFDPLGVDREQLKREGWLLRPSELLFTAQKRTYAIILTWLPGQPAVSLKFKA